MNNSRYISDGATLEMQRSTATHNPTAYYHAFHGFLMPLFTYETLPGDTWQVNLKDFTRMSAPIAPFFGNIKKHFAAFHTPKRILWNKTKQFYGEAETFGVASKVTEPCSINTAATITRANMSLSGVTDGSASNFNTIGCFLGLIREGGSIAADERTPINVLPARAFLDIYNNHFRDENFCMPYTWNKEQSGNLDIPFGMLGETYINAYSILPKVRKDNDAFTTFLPYVTKTSSPIFISLTGDAPVIATTQSHDLIDNVAMNYKSVDGYVMQSGQYYDLSVNGGNKSASIMSGGASGSFVGRLAPENLWADMSKVSGVALSDLLYTIAYNNFAQKLAKFGSRYTEYIRSIFGVNTDDATADIPEFLGHYGYLLNVDTVVQTTGHQPGQGSELGELGGYSASYRDANFFTYTSKEPGYITIVSYFKHERIYSSGMDEIFLKSELLDYYQTPFANIEDTPYSQDLLYFEGTKTASDIKFGFNEPWWSNRNFKDRVIGLIDPKNNNSFDYWSLAEKWNNAPILGQSFIEEDRRNIVRCLTTGELGPDYICNTTLDIKLTRVMPIYSSGRIGDL